MPKKCANVSFRDRPLREAGAPITAQQHSECPVGSRQEENRTRVPLEAVGGESRDPRSVFHRTCWDGSHTQAFLQGAPQGARLAMGQNATAHCDPVKMCCTDTHTGSV